MKNALKSIARNEKRKKYISGKKTEVFCRMKSTAH